MQTFSIQTGTYEGFTFGVNPVDSSIVEFGHFSKHVDADEKAGITGDDHEGDYTVIAQFNRNGGFIRSLRVPLVSETHVMQRDIHTGQPAVVLLPVVEEVPVVEKHDPVWDAKTQQRVQGVNA